MKQVVDSKIVSIFEKILRMKRILFALLFLVSILPSAVQAQKGLKVGFTASPLNSWMLNQQDIDAPEADFKYRTTWGMQGGLTGGVNFSNRFGIMANILYSAQGQRFTTNPEGLDRGIKNNIALYYLKLPVMLRFSTKPVKKVVWSIYGGMQIAHLTKAKFFNDDYRFIPDNPNVRYPNTRDLYNEWYYSLVGGFGADVRLTRQLYLNLNVRVENGIMDTEKKSAQYYERQFNRLLVRNYYPDNRPETALLVYGFNFGFTYHFIKGR
jgi:hypothetical protein